MWVDQVLLFLRVTGLTHYLDTQAVLIIWAMWVKRCIFSSPISIHPADFSIRLEMSIGIILACVPTLRPLLHSDLFANLFHRRPGAKSKSYGNKIDHVGHKCEQQGLRQATPVEDDLSRGFASLSSLENQHTTGIHGEAANSRDIQSAQAVRYSKGASKATQIQMSVFEKWPNVQDHMTTSGSKVPCLAFPSQYPFRSRHFVSFLRILISSTTLGPSM